jgi:hypothetical protein
VALRSGLAAVLFSAGCLTTLAPRIAARDHHAGISPQTSNGECLSCHEPEVTAASRLDRLDARRRRIAEAELATQPPLVAAWMMEDRRPCAACHARR